MKVESKGLIRKQWEFYRRAVMPRDAGDVQKIETRRAFYAGVEAMFRIQFVIGDKSVSEDRGVEILESVNEELKRFADGIKSGIN